MSTPENRLQSDGQANPNMLPADDFTAHKQGNATRKRAKRVKIADFVNNVLFEGIHRKFEPERLQRTQKWRENRLMERGNQWLVWNPGLGNFQNRLDMPDVTPAEKARMKIVTNNKIMPAVRNLVKEIVASTPAFQAEARSNKTQQMAAAKVAQSLLDLDEERNEEPDMRQREGMFQLNCGNVFKRTYYDPTGGGTIQKPEVVTEEEPGGVGFTCPDCGMEGDAAGLMQGPDIPQVQTIEGQSFVNAKCTGPECQSNTLALKEYPPTTKEKKITVTQTVGVPRSDLVDPLYITVDTSANDLESSTFIHCERMIQRAVLEAAYPWADISSEPASTPLRIAEQLSQNVGANASTQLLATDQSTSGPFEDIKYEEAWFAPCVYQDYVVETEEKIGDPQAPTLTIPAGTRFGDMFKKGLRINRAGKRILDIRDEDKNDVWSHCGYTINIDGFWCDDMVSQIVELQKRYNHLDAIQMANAMTHAITNLVFNRKYIDPAKYSSDPSRNIIVCEESAAMLDKLQGRAFDVIPATPILAEVQEHKMNLAGDIQSNTGSEPTFATKIDAPTRTATEAGIARDMQLGLIAPAMALRAQAEIKRKYQYLQICKDKFVKGQYANVLGKYKDYEIQAFLSCNIRQDIEITYAPGSHVPRTLGDKRRDLDELAQYGGVEGGIYWPGWPKEFRRKVIESRGNPVDIDADMPDRRNADKRLQQLQQYIAQNGQEIAQEIANVPQQQQQMAFQTAVQVAVDQLPSFPTIDTHQDFADVYTEWMKTDSGQSAAKFLQACVLNLIAFHSDQVKQAASAATDQQLEQVGKAGMLEATPDLLLQAMKGDQEMERESMIHGLESEQQATEHQHAADMKVLDQAHASESAEEDREHQSEMADQQHENALEIQKNAPKPAAKGKK